MEYPDNLKYTKDHEWLRVEDDGETATVGITEFAQSELGDIVFLEIDTLNEDLSKDDVFGTVEAVKTVSELFMPVSGTVIAFNEELEDSPELVNDDPYGDGWLIRLKMSDSDELGGLLDASAYRDMVGA